MQNGKPKSNRKHKKSLNYFMNPRNWWGPLVVHSDNQCFGSGYDWLSNLL